jgi:hypothetical protein
VETRHPRSTDYRAAQGLCWIFRPAGPGAGERQQAAEEWRRWPARSGAASALNHLSAASAAGRELAVRLQLQTAALRRQLAAETARGRLLLSLASPEPTGHRVNVRS